MPWWSPNTSCQSRALSSGYLTAPLAFGSCLGDLWAWFCLWLLLRRPSSEISVWPGPSALVRAPIQSRPGDGLWLYHWLKKPGPSRRFSKQKQIQSLEGFSINFPVLPPCVGIPFIKSPDVSSARGHQLQHLQGGKNQRRPEVDLQLNEVQRERHFQGTYRFSFHLHEVKNIFFLFFFFFFFFFFNPSQTGSCSTVFTSQTEPNQNSLALKKKKKWS